MSSQDFYLSQLNVSVDASSATLSGVDTTAFTGDAIAAVQIPLSHVMTMFQFHTDSTDITDVSSNDLSYKTVYTSSAAPLNIDLDTNTTVIDGAIDSNAADKHVDFDYVRYLARELFNTHLGVDLISNEESLRTTLNADFKSKFNVVLVDLSNVGITYNNNPSPAKSILDQVIDNDPDRLSDINPLSLGDSWYMAPLVPGDILYFRLTVSAATGQHALTGVDPISPRTYLIKATMQ